MLWAGGFHHESDYVLVFFINKIHFDFGNLPVPHAERHCRVNKRLQFIDSHVMVSARRVMPESAVSRVTVVDRRFALIDRPPTPLVRFLNLQYKKLPVPLQRGRPLLDRRQRLLQIFNNVHHILNPHRNPDQSIRNSNRFSPFLAQRRMRHGCRM